MKALDLFAVPIKQPFIFVAFWNTISDVVSSSYHFSFCCCCKLNIFKDIIQAGSFVSHLVAVRLMRSWLAIGRIAGRLRSRCVGAGSYGMCCQWPAVCPLTTSLADRKRSARQLTCKYRKIARLTLYRSTSTARERHGNLTALAQGRKCLLNDSVNRSDSFHLM